MNENRARRRVSRTMRSHPAAIEGFHFSSVEGVAFLPTHPHNWEYLPMNFVDVFWKLFFGTSRKTLIHGKMVSLESYGIRMWKRHRVCRELRTTKTPKTPPKPTATATTTSLKFWIHAFFGSPPPALRFGVDYQHFEADWVLAKFSPSNLAGKQHDIAGETSCFRCLMDGTLACPRTEVRISGWFHPQ